MKKLFFLFVFLCTLIVSGIAQVPNFFNYQAVVRSSSGEIIGDTDVSFRISILQGSESGSIVYSETHTIRTNSFGLVNLKIGNGTIVEGSLNPEDWDSDSHFIKVELDAEGGSAFTDFGTSQLLAVPYAFHAISVENDEVNDADADPENELQTISLSGTNLTLSDGGGTVTLPSSGGGDNWGTQTVESDATLDGDGTATNPLSVIGDLTDDQTLSISGNDLTISDGNTVTIPSSPWDSDGSNIFTTNKRVGIGESVEGLRTFQVITSTDLAIAAENNTTSLPTLHLNNKSGGTAAWIVGEVVIKDGTEGNDKILTSREGGYAYWKDPDFTVWKKSGSDIYYDSGKVGIGTSSPSYYLSLNSGSESAYFSMQNDLTGSNPSDGFTIGTPITNRNAYIWNYENASLIFGTKALARMTINSSGYVGIGTETPAAGLHLKGTGYPAAFMYLEANSGQDAGFRLYEGTTAKWHIFNNSGAGGLQIYNDAGQTAIFAKQSNAYVGLGTTTPTQKLHVVGNAYKTDGGTSWATSSDLRLKNITGKFAKGLNEISALNPVKYIYKKNNQRELNSTVEQVGFVAQEVQKIFPEAVTEGEDGYLDFNIHPINIAMVNAIKDLKNENEKLSAKVQDLESRLKQIEAMFSVSATK